VRSSLVIWVHRSDIHVRDNEEFYDSHSSAVC